jgi:hypothetical protein
MKLHLVVVRAFGAYAKGDAITDADAMARVLSSENARDVVRVRSAAKEG